MSLATVESVNWVFVVDYDIPAGKQRSKVESNRIMFYQAVHRMLRKKLGKDVKFSTYSCYFTPDEQLAKEFLEVVHKYNGKGNIYRAVKVE
jgi:hypothetical protein